MQAVKEVVAWQLAEAMKKKKNLEEQDGHAAETSRYVDRLLNAKDDISLSTLQRAAAKDRSPRQNRAGVTTVACKVM